MPLSVFITGAATGIGQVTARKLWQRGSKVMAAAAEHLTSVTLELGGKSPAIVDETALVDDAAYKIAWGKCANGGQACVAPDYVLAHHTVHDDLVAQMETAVRTMYDPEGTGIQHSPAFPRIINQRHFRRVEAMLEDALAKGATLVTGGECDAADNYISPTILTSVTNDMAVMQEEIFGPILPVKKYRSREDVVQHVRQGQKPLALYVYSTSRENITYFLQNTSSGSSVINHNMVQAGINPHLPFGGVNNSGMGRIGGHATFTTFSNPRSVVEQPTGWQDFSHVSFPPYSRIYRLMLNV